MEIRDEAPEGWPSIADAGCYTEPDDKGEFLIWFSVGRGVPGLSTIAHECWHLFMTILGYADKNEYSFDVLDSEIYAYNFQVYKDEKEYCNILGISEFPSQYSFAL